MLCDPFISSLPPSLPFLPFSFQFGNVLFYNPIQKLCTIGKSRVTFGPLGDGI